jgi:ankyrin repeat protein
MSGLNRRTIIVAGALIAMALLPSPLRVPAAAQVAPDRAELAAYAGLHRAAANGDAVQIKALLAEGADPNARDAAGRTPLHVAAFGSRYDAVRALVAGGADINALENSRYDVVTIAAVKNDVRMVKLALELGADPKLITSPYAGTALIAAAHLGHADVVRTLIAARAPLDHINNLGWTALIESIVLGDGGKTHTDTLEALVEAGADVNLGDRGGQTPLKLASGRGYASMVRILKDAGAR